MAPFGWMINEEPRPNVEQDNEAGRAPGTVTDALLERVRNIDLTSIADQHARELIGVLFNLVEELRAELRKAESEVAYWKRKAGERQGGGNKPPGAGTENAPKLSSEKERQQPKPWHKRSKLERIVIDREEVVKLDRATLPGDAEFKGYEEVVVQDLGIATDNVKFRKEKYYSATTGKTYLAPLPAGYGGEFGPNVKSLCVVFGHLCHMSEGKIREWFGEMGVEISEGQISNFLSQGHEALHQEKEQIVEAGLKSSPWHHLDDTGTRVDGQNWHCHVLCNPLYTAYCTREGKDRMTVLDVLRNGRSRQFRWNEESERLVQQWGVAQRCRRVLEGFPRDRDVSEGEWNQWMSQNLPGSTASALQPIAEAMALAAYHAGVGGPVVRLLICDDAKQFKLLTEELALCWIHDGRHYKELNPWAEAYRQALECFRKSYWDYYRELLAYREKPSPEEAERLSREFDRLFSTPTGYDALNRRIAKTRANKAHLLMVLLHPEIPLHNNPVELEARARVRKRVVSYGPRSVHGARSWDTFQTLLATSKKLGVSFYQYIRDRIGGLYRMPSLADLITQRAKTISLGTSWSSRSSPDY